MEEDFLLPNSDSPFAHDEIRHQGRMARLTRTKSSRGKAAAPAASRKTVRSSSSRSRRGAQQTNTEVGNKSDEEAEDEEDTKKGAEVDLGIEYLVKLLKVGAEVYIRDTPNVRIREETRKWIGGKGVIKQVMGKQSPSTFYAVEVGETRTAKEEIIVLGNSLVPTDLSGTPKNFVPDSELEVKESSRSRNASGKGKQKRTPLENIKVEDWIGKQVVFTQGKYTGENAWILGEGCGLAHLIMGDDDDTKSPPVIVSRSPKQLAVVPEDNPEIEPFNPEDYLQKTGSVTDGYGIGDKGFVSAHGSGYLLVQLMGEKKYTVLKVISQFKLDEQKDAAKDKQSGGKKSLKRPAPESDAGNANAGNANAGKDGDKDKGVASTASQSKKAKHADDKKKADATVKKDSNSGKKKAGKEKSSDTSEESDDSDSDDGSDDTDESDDASDDSDEEDSDEEDSDEEDSDEETSEDDKSSEGSLTQSKNASKGGEKREGAGKKASNSTGTPVKKIKLANAEVSPGSPIDEKRQKEMERIKKREKEKMKAKEKILKEQTMRKSSRSTKGQRYSQNGGTAPPKPKVFVPLNDRDREEAEAAAQFATHVSMYHDRVRKYMEREIEKQKVCGRTDITDALMRLEREWGWDDGDSEDDSSPTYEWENENKQNKVGGPVFDMIQDEVCPKCLIPMERKCGMCWNVGCVASPVYASAKGGLKKQQQHADDAKALYMYQTVAPVAWVGTPAMFSRVREGPEHSEQPYTIPPLKSLPEPEPVVEEEVDPNQRASRSASAPKPEPEKEPEMTWREKLDYMAGVNFTKDKPALFFFDTLHKYDDSNGNPCVYSSKSGYQATEDDEEITPAEWARRRHMSEMEMQISEARHILDPIEDIDDSYVITKNPDTVKEGEESYVRISPRPRLHPLDDLRRRAAEEEQAERLRQYESENGTSVAENDSDIGAVSKVVDSNADLTTEETAAPLVPVLTAGMNL